MKNLQHNNPTIGAQGYNLVDKASEDVYIYKEAFMIKSLVFIVDLNGSQEIECFIGKDDGTGTISIDNLYLNTPNGNITLSRGSNRFYDRAYILDKDLAIPKDKDLTINLMGEQCGKIGGYSYQSSSKYIDYVKNLDISDQVYFTNGSALNFKFTRYDFSVKPNTGINLGNVGNVGNKYGILTFTFSDGSR